LWGDILLPVDRRGDRRGLDFTQYWPLSSKVTAELVGEAKKAGAVFGWGKTSHDVINFMIIAGCFS